MLSVIRLVIDLILPIKKKKTMLITKLVSLYFVINNKKNYCERREKEGKALFKHLQIKNVFSRVKTKKRKKKKKKRVQNLLLLHTIQTNTETCCFSQMKQPYIVCVQLGVNNNRQCFFLIKKLKVFNISNPTYIYYQQKCLLSGI